LKSIEFRIESFFFASLKIFVFKEDKRRPEIAGNDGRESCYRKFLKKLHKMICSPPKKLKIALPY
jgi:hypothetical protein